MIAVLCALFARNVLGAGAGGKRNAPARISLLCAFLPMIVGVPSIVVLARVSTATSTALTRAEAVQYVKAHTELADSVLMWGAEPGVNFAAQRRSPSRFAYQYALLTSGYTGGPLISVFLREIETGRPTLIIDASPSDGITPPLDSEARKRWRPSLVYRLQAELDMFFQYVDTHYQLAGSLGPDGWQVYVRKQGGLASRQHMRKICCGAANSLNSLMRLNQHS
ncbi:MAG: hypothetical protein ABJA50_13450 [Chloroflexota bacterium]